ncbi:hypothetical protein HPB50_004424 [Hyalomma asiaticum]|uniref:Uncharacterized protein n=1 Tax=Hyalomma asiaticum TaxID=266040 RepID=A0ACB7TH01_HYAAI|nr:hypothetical protein HPB50_004424 [Hyalomma asiaticum]
MADHEKTRALPNERIVCTSAYARRKEGRVDELPGRPNTAPERRPGDDGGALRSCPSKPHNDPAPTSLSSDDADDAKTEPWCSMRSHGASPA